MKRIALLVCFVLPLGTKAQEAISDTVHLASDTIMIRKGGKTWTATQYAKRFQPRKALLLAAVLPGSGQIYNRKYWKVPIVYGGFFILTSFALSYNKAYHKYQDQLYGVLETPSIPSPDGYSEAQLRTLVDNYRRQRDFFLILDGIFYILQMVDAHVDAHLKEFDLNPNLHVRIEPTSQPCVALGQVPGLSLTFKF